MPFSHEKLIVYQRSIEFVAWLEPLVEKRPAKIAAKDQLDRASTSVPLNIAEGESWVVDALQLLQQFPRSADRSYRQMRYVSAFSKSIPAADVDKEVRRLIV